MQPLKLSVDEKDAIVSLLDAEGYRTFLAILDYHVSLQEEEVLAMRLEASTDSVEKLAYAKSRAEGARKLVTAVVKYLTGLKPTQKKPSV